MPRITKFVLRLRINSHSLSHSESSNFPQGVISGENTAVAFMITYILKKVLNFNFICISKEFPGLLQDTYIFSILFQVWKCNISLSRFSRCVGTGHWFASKEKVINFRFEPMRASYQPQIISPMQRIYESKLSRFVKRSICTKRDSNCYQDGPSYFKSCELILRPTRICLTDKHYYINRLHSRTVEFLKCQFPGKPVRF